ncbi:hypothetical protein OK016_15175 [Vibrio chagasii]|nr:hypothetical protein [Vibrio chagasii]
MINQLIPQRSFLRLFKNEAAFMDVFSGGKVGWSMRNPHCREHCGYAEISLAITSLGSSS